MNGKSAFISFIPEVVLIPRAWDMPIFRAAQLTRNYVRTVRTVGNTWKPYSWVFMLQAMYGRILESPVNVSRL